MWKEVIEDNPYLQPHELKPDTNIQNVIQCEICSLSIYVVAEFASLDKETV